MIVLQQWGPALLIVFSILLGIIYNNTRLTDLRNHFDKRLDEMNSRISAVESRLTALEGRVSALEGRVSALEARVSALEARLDEMKDLIRSEIKRLEDRIEQRLLRP